VGKSSAIRERDVRALLRLSAELSELPRETVTRCTHMLTGLCRIVGARWGVYVASDGVLPNGQVKVFFFSNTEMDTSEQRVLGEFLLSGEPCDPLSPKMHHQIADAPVGPLTQTREQVIDDATWYGCDHFNVVRRGCRVDDVINTKLHLPDRRTVVQSFGIHRELHDTHFGERERLLVEIFHQEVGSVMVEKISRSTPETASLPPRLKQVLATLLQGRSEKQIARVLAISQHTVHDYVKTLYRRYGVNGRTELLALWIDPL
jgi:DNA-binding CsgD family transcriptional regulator